MAGPADAALRPGDADDVPRPPAVRCCGGLGPTVGAARGHPLLAERGGVAPNARLIGSP